MATNCSFALQSEDKEGETPLSLAAVHQGLRQAMVALARGQVDIS